MYCCPSMAENTWGCCSGETRKSSLNKWSISLKVYHTLRQDFTTLKGLRCTSFYRRGNGKNTPFMLHHRLSGMCVCRYLIGSGPSLCWHRGLRVKPMTKLRLLTQCWWQIKQQSGSTLGLRPHVGSLDMQKFTGKCLRWSTFLLVWYIYN